MREIPGLKSSHAEATLLTDCNEKSHMYSLNATLAQAENNSHHTLAKT